MTGAVTARLPGCLYAQSGVNLTLFGVRFGLIICHI